MQKRKKKKCNKYPSKFQNRWLPPCNLVEEDSRGSDEERGRGRYFYCLAKELIGPFSFSFFFFDNKMSLIKKALSSKSQS